MRTWAIRLSLPCAVDYTLGTVEASVRLSKSRWASKALATCQYLYDANRTRQRGRTERTGRARVRARARARERERERYPSFQNR